MFVLIFVFTSIFPANNGRILPYTCFSFSYDDPWLKGFIQMFNDAGDIIGNGFVSDFIPALTFLERKKLSAFQSITDAVTELITN